MREPWELFGPVRRSRRSEFPSDESVAWASPRFALWTGSPPGSSYGGKAIVEHDAQPAFAEIAIVRTLAKDGWSAVWVSQAFGRPKFRNSFWTSEPPPVVPDSALQQLAHAATRRGGSYKGTWDVLAWPSGSDAPSLTELRFLESKRLGRDAIDGEQVAWFHNLRAHGAANEAFLVIEWALTQPVT